MTNGLTSSKVDSLSLLAKKTLLDHPAFYFRKNAETTVNNQHYLDLYSWYSKNTDTQGTVYQAMKRADPRTAPTEIQVAKALIRLGYMDKKFIIDREKWDELTRTGISLTYDTDALFEAAKYPDRINRRFTAALESIAPSVHYIKTEMIRLGAPELIMRSFENSDISELYMEIHLTQGKPLPFLLESLMIGLLANRMI